MGTQQESDLLNDIPYETGSCSEKNVEYINENYV